MIKLNKKTTLAIGLMMLALSGCSTFRQPAPGATLADVTARLGKPNAVYPSRTIGPVISRNCVRSRARRVR